MAYDYNLTGYAPGALSSVTAPTSPAVAQPSAATGYPGGSALADAIAAAYATNPEAMTAMMSSPYEWTFNLSSNRGNPTGEVAVGKDTPIMLIDNRTGQVVSSGTGVDAAKAIHDMAANLTNTLGRKADWSIYTAPAGATSTDQYKLVANEKPNASTLGKIADVALPAALAAIPGLGTLGAAAAAAGGSAASSIAQGRSLTDTLTRAALTGLGSYAGGQLLGNLGSTTTNVAGQTVGEAAKAAAENVAAAELARQGVTLGGDIIVNAALPSLAGSAAGGALGGLSSGVLTNAAKPDFADNFTDLATGENVINVTGNLPTTSAAGSAAGGALGGAPLVTTGPNGENIITATAQAPKPSAPTASATVPASVAGALTAAGGTGTTTSPETSGTADKPTTLSDIANYLRLAGLATGALGSLTSGNGSSSGATISGTTGSLNPIFKSQLPAANLPGTVDRQPRDLTGTDWNRYAFGPEKSFFTDVPQRLAHGGALRHSDGRSDDIPAMLSNNEYVIDAETMALLGNGDPRAGADRMDQWRVNVRKHKGRDLAKGKISRNAKMPGDYMGGGRI